MERDDELAAIADAIRATREGQGRALLIEGPAGIGKTTLLAAARSAAAADGFTVLRARASELERELGWGVVVELFEHAVRARPTSLLRGQARAAAPVLGFEDPSAPRDDVSHRRDLTFSALRGLYWVAMNLAEHAPVALLVDDVHHADAPSVRFLAYLAQRLDGARILLAAAARAGLESARVAPALASFERITPAPLSLLATSELVRKTMPEAADSFCRACFEASGGNVFFVIELLREAVADTGGFEQRGPPEVPARAPRSIMSSVASRLAILPADARDLARAVAILGDDAKLRLAAELGGLSISEAGLAADTLRGAWIFAPDEELRFIHPIVRAAVYEELAPGARSEQHARAAEVLAADHAPVEHVALHILRCDSAGSDERCERLRSAAAAALGRGAPDSAVDYLQRALREPPAAPSRAAVLLELGIAEAAIFELSAALGHLRQSFDVASDRQQRLAAATAGGAFATHGIGADTLAGVWLPRLERLRAEYADEAAAHLALGALIANLARFELSAMTIAKPLSRELRARALEVDEVDCRELTADVLAAYAAELAMAGASAARVTAVSRLGIGNLRQNEHVVGNLVYLILLRTLITADELDLARRLLDELIEHSRGTGSILDFAFASVFRANLNYRRGDVFEAEEDARSAYELAREHGWPTGAPALVADTVHVLIERGLAAQAQELIQSSGLDRPAEELSTLYPTNLLLHARGRLHRIRGHARSALADLVECGRREDLWEEFNPSLIAWRSEAALAARALGDHDRAAALAGEELALARGFGAPRALGVALRVAAAVTEGSEGLSYGEESVAVLAGSPARLEHARALADLGERLRALGRGDEAQAVLREALELSHVCGAAALERQVIEGLRSTGARPRRPHLSGPRALTPRERKVAGLAAEGLSNRQIAEILFVTVRTVEFHLAGAYRKLRIDARTELPAALDADRPPTPRSRDAAKPEARRR